MLKNNPDTADLKILMLTGHVFRESEQNARAAGVDMFVGKPCLPDVLHGHILTLAGRRPPAVPLDPPSGKKQRAPRGIRTRPRLL